MELLNLWWRYLPSFLEGLLVTVQLTACGVLLAVVVGALLAAARMSRSRSLRFIATWYIEIVRATPTLVVLLVTYFGLGSIGILFPAFWAAVVGLGMYYAAHFAENFRGGIESVDRGQWEASDALGMSAGLRMRKVILPQSFLPILLPSTNTVAYFIKDTSLVLVIGVADLTTAASQASSDTYRPMDMYVFAGLIYFALYLLISRVLARWELNVQKRRN